MKMFVRLHYLLFSAFVLISFSAHSQQPAWKEVKSAYVNSYSSQLIYGAVNNPQGDVYASIGNNVYHWSPPGWVALGEGANGLNANSQISVLTADGAGNVYAAGWFTNAAGKCFVARWNGAAWGELGTGANVLNASGPIFALATDAQGNLYAAGTFINGSGRRYVAKWNGTAWAELGSGSAALNANQEISALAVDGSGNVYAAGLFANTAGKPYVAKWNGSFWSEVGGSSAPLNPNLYIRSLATDAGGNVYAAGQFTNASNECYVARWNGNTWSELGSGSNALHANSWIRTIRVHNGQLYAGGEFCKPNGTRYVARWNGTSWSEVGLNMGGLMPTAGIYAVAFDGAGNVYAAGDFANGNGSRYVALWTAASDQWAEAGFNGTGQLTGSGINAALTDPAGNVYVAGDIYSTNGRRNVYKWNGQFWSAVGAPTAPLGANSTVEALALDRFGNLYAAGSFTNDLVTYAGKIYVAKWNGTAWTELGTGTAALNPNGPIKGMVTDSAGNVYVAGQFTNAAGKYYVAKWNGSTWSELGTGNNALNTTKPIYQLCIDRQGRIYAPAFHYTNGLYYYVARWDGTRWSELYNGVNPLNSDEATTPMAVDTAGHVYAMVEIITEAVFLPQVRRWDGTDWKRFQGLRDFEYVRKITADAYGNVYFYGDGRLRRWNGTRMDVLAASGAVREVNAITVTPSREIYGGDLGAFPFPVGRLDTLALSLPDLRNVANQCLPAAAARGKVANPPYNGAVTAEQDGQAIPYNAADSSFTYYIQNTTAPGTHTVRIRFANAANTAQKDSTYSVSPTVVPAVTITGSSVITPGQPSVLRSTIQNGGSAPQYQWQDSTAQHNWLAIAGATGSSLSYAAQVGNAVRCLVSGNAPCASSPTANSNVLRFDAVTALNPVGTGTQAILVGPNPATVKLVVGPFQWPTNIDGYKICDMQGRLLRQGRLQRGQRWLEIPVNAYAAGSYFLILQSRDGLQQGQVFMKQ